MESRIDQLTKDIAKRIRPVMPDIPEDEFSLLVTRMAALEHKYEGRARADFLRSEGYR